MTKAEGEQFDALEFTDDIVRGASWSYTLKLYNGSGGGCGPVIRGDALDLSGFNSVSAEAKLGGSRASLPVTALMETFGDEGVPARLVVKVVSGNVERVFEDGGNQTFDVAVFVQNAAQERTPILVGSVYVEDSAAGGDRP